MSQSLLFLYCLLWMGSFLLSASPAMAIEDKPDNARETVLSLVEALRAVEHPTSGRGTAVVQLTRPIVTEKGLIPKIVNEELVEFVFKDQMTRAKKFDFKDGQKGSLKTAFTVGKDFHAYYTGHEIWITSKPEYHWYRAFAQDFHPTTFDFIQTGGTVADILENDAKKGTDPIVVDEKDNGLVTIRIGNSQLCVLDKAKGCRLVEFKLDHVFPERGIDHHMHIRILWKRYGSTWYVEEAEKKEASHQSLSPSVLVRTLDFKPDVEVKDAEFDLASLDVPTNTWIINKITGQTYRYEH